MKPAQVSAGLCDGLWTGQGNRREAGGSRKNYSIKSQCVDSPTSCLMDIWVRWEGGKIFGWFGGFFTLLWSFSPTLEVKKPACSITSPPTSCIFFPCALSSQAKSISKMRAILQAFLLLRAPNSNKALILVTCAKQSTLFFLLCVTVEIET